MYSNNVDATLGAGNSKTMSRIDSADRSNSANAVERKAKSRFRSNATFQSICFPGGDVAQNIDTCKIGQLRGDDESRNLVIVFW
jgi:hypothetical protein